MRDIFDDIRRNLPFDPLEAARRGARPKLRRRFYQRAEVAQDDSRHALVLDGKPVQTPARRALAAPSRALAEALAAEWNAQAEVIEPAKMPLTRLANSIIDGVAVTSAPVAAEIEKYLGSDLLYYRAPGPEGLVTRQAERWDPIIAWARDALGARFLVAEGMTFVAQPLEALAAARAAIPADPWRLGALHSITTLTGSALIALAVGAGRLSAEEASAAAHVEEDWNMAQWGHDEDALERRALRFTEIDAAVRVLTLLEP